MKINKKNKQITKRRKRIIKVSNKKNNKIRLKMMNMNNLVMMINKI